MVLHCSFDLHFSKKLVILSIFYCVFWQSVDQKDPLEKEMVTNSNIIAWEISWAEEPDGVQSMGSQRVRHNLATTSPLEKCVFRSSHVLLGCPGSSFTCSPSLVILQNTSLLFIFADCEFIPIPRSLHLWFTLPTVLADPSSSQLFFLKALHNCLLS